MKLIKIRDPTNSSRAVCDCRMRCGCSRYRPRPLGVQQDVKTTSRPAHPCREGKAPPLWPASQRLRVSPASPMCCCRCSCEIWEGRAQPRVLLIADSDVVVGLLAGEVAVLPASLNRSDGPSRFWVGVVSEREQKSPGQLGRANRPHRRLLRPNQRPTPWPRSTPAATKAPRHRPSYNRLRCITSRSRTRRQNIQDGQLFSRFFCFSLFLQKPEGSFWKAPAEGCGCAGRLSCPCRLKVKFVPSSQLSDVRRRDSSDRRHGVIRH
ncbi:hypothetical protein K456DRAFT_912265 [Colletotrichum gloeosporioides 23]|nr:hypothetical protein K456DRAFT_912265 [Colletotrichum gloeosporioides 23]